MYEHVCPLTEFALSGGAGVVILHVVRARARQGVDGQERLPEARGGGHTVSVLALCRVAVFLVRDAALDRARVGGVKELALLAPANGEALAPREVLALSLGVVLLLSLAILSVSMASAVPSPRVAGACFLPVLERSQVPGQILVIPPVGPSHSAILRVMRWQYLRHTLPVSSGWANMV